MVWPPSYMMTSSSSCEGAVDGLRLRAAPLVRSRARARCRRRRSRRPAARVAGGRDGQAGGAVVGAVAGQDLVAAGDLAGQLDGVLVGLGAAVGEEGDVQVAGRQLGQLAAQAGARLVGHEGVREGQPLGLGRDGVDDALVAVADVDGHRLAVEVKEAPSVGRVEVGALGRGDRDRDRPRSGPPTRRACTASRAPTISSALSGSAFVAPGATSMAISNLV